MRWYGDNWREVYDFVGEKASATAHNPGPEATAGPPLQLLAGKDGAQGWVSVPVGHWIVRMPGDPSDYWPVEADYFASKYEPVEASRGRVRSTMVKRDLVVDVRVADIPEVKALLARLRRAFDRYAQHDDECAVAVHGGVCDCGLVACLDGLGGCSDIVCDHACHDLPPPLECCARCAQAIPRNGLHKCGRREFGGQR